MMMRLAVSAIGSLTMVAGPSPARVAVMATAASVRSSALDPVVLAVREASLRFGVPELWIRAVIRAESFGDPRAVSPKGAVGLMQVIPSTYAALRPQLHLGPDPFEVHDNVLAGTAYLRLMFDRYGPVGMVGAYNAGPARWVAYLAGVQPLPDETVGYLSRLAPALGFAPIPLRLDTPASAPPLRSEPSIFAALTSIPDDQDLRAKRRVVAQAIAANPSIVAPSATSSDAGFSSVTSLHGGGPEAPGPPASGLFAPDIHPKTQP